MNDDKYNVPVQHFLNLQSAFPSMLVTSYYSCKYKTSHVDSFLIGAIGISSVIANKWNMVV